MSEHTHGQHEHGHQHTHDHGGPRREMPPLPDSADGLPDWWEQLYSGDGTRWSGNANARLVEAVAALEAGGVAPGRALDLGCGEGGDVVWLAERGWSVTGVDVAHAAVAKARSAAAARGVDVVLERHDLTQTFPEGEFDLVNAQFLQAPVGWPRAEVLRRAAAAVAHGGHLLVVDHAEPPPWADLDARARIGFPTPQQVLADLALGEEWQVLRAEVAGRTAAAPAGSDQQHGHLNDSVVLVRRLP
ncbi:Methyltransferase domain-containing protein [Quadrisphaera granulorum]|uniref:Methyltransferase family protein n=1 Tax=Quadrisphaera granulorum TaxID=317664 RepID=A0A315ZZC6_9ACTN|nr:class I SAM-dependent methyltransferase [Quadrisphaera granulorum]PWJ50258.1 methyltransferase family protein [Quadrisphaera granulorum]SZE98024.1 Methyltransferase domain-containing protein [Quadrisphaera granulorum]